VGVEAGVRQQRAEDIRGEGTAPIVGNPAPVRRNEGHGLTGFGMSNSIRVTMMSRCLSWG